MTQPHHTQTFKNSNHVLLFEDIEKIQAFFQDSDIEYIPTFHAMGYMARTLDAVQKEFLKFAQDYRNEEFLDIGCAFGNTTLPLLKNHIHVHAWDVDFRYKQWMMGKISPDHQNYLHWKTGIFPQNLPMKPYAFRGIIFSMVLHFVEPVWVEKTFSELAKGLKRGGRLFLTASSVYQRVLRPFWNRYWILRRQKAPFPGYIHDIAAYVPHRSHQLPRKNTLYQADELVAWCQRYGLRIVQSGYFSREKMPKDIAMDGREYVFVIAEKPTFHDDQGFVKSDGPIGNRKKERHLDL